MPSFSTACVNFHNVYVGHAYDTGHVDDDDIIVEDEETVVFEITAE